MRRLVCALLILFALFGSNAWGGGSSFGATGKIGRVSHYPVWGTSFVRSADYLYFDGSSNFAFGTGDFTIAMWVKFSDLPGGSQSDQMLYDSRPANTNGNYPLISMLGTGGFVFQYGINSSVINGTTAVILGKWYHVAVTRSGTSVRLFINGVQEGSTLTDSTNCGVGASKPGIGVNSFTSVQRGFSGTMTDLIVLKGTALWTSNFNPPIAPMTAVANTSILTCQSSTLVDNSPNNVVIGHGGNPIQVSLPNYP
jgi:hypothetical protein